MISSKSKILSSRQQELLEEISSISLLTQKKAKTDAAASPSGKDAYLDSVWAKDVEVKNWRQT